MPTYDYICKECDHEIEALQKFSDIPLSNCPQCGKESLQRGVGGGAGLSFKGTGFYITDYVKNTPQENCSANAESCPCSE